MTPSSSTLVINSLAYQILPGQGGVKQQSDSNDLGSAGLYTLCVILMFQNNKSRELGDQKYPKYHIRAINHRGFYSNITILALK